MVVPTGQNTNLEVKVKCLEQVNPFRETIVLLHVVSQSEVSVRSVPLRKEPENEVLFILNNLLVHNYTPTLSTTSR